MAVSIENIGAGLGGKISPIDPGSQATYAAFAFDNPGPTGPLPSYCSTAYIGSDTQDMGLQLKMEPDPQMRYILHIQSTSINPPPSGSIFQSGLVFWAWPLAWYTQVRRHHQSVISINEMDQSGNGVQSISCIGCFTGNTANGGQCYAFTAAVSGDDPQHRVYVNLQRWTFPNIPAISNATSPRTPLVIETLDSGGYLEEGPGDNVWGDRLFLYCVDKGSTWDISGWIVKHANYISPWVWELRAYVKDIHDPGIQGGMAATAFNTWSSTAPWSVQGAVVYGWGPNDRPPVLP